MLILKNRFFICCLVFFATTLFTLRYGSFPEIYFFATDQNLSPIERLLTAPIHLSDDVMITFRTGYILNETGIPAFNRIDLAQPSTSYLMPYVISALLKLMPDNIAIITYVGLGFLSVLIVFLTIITTSKFLINGLILVLALCLTVTHTAYSVNGWDHLFQSALLSIGAALILKSKNNPSIYLTAATCLALGVFARPDGTLISLSLLIYSYLINRNRIRVFFSLILPFLILIFIGLIINFSQFSHFTPTPVRLKLGNSPSIEYAIVYLLQNGLLSYSAITLVIIFLILYFAQSHLANKRAFTPVVFGCGLTILVAAINSDAFHGGRMFWSSACVMAVLLARIAPKFLVLRLEKLKTFVSLGPEYKKKFIFSKKFVKFSTLAFLITIALSIFFHINKSEKFDRLLVRDNSINPSGTARIYKIAKWMEKNLNKNDGSIGLFQAGMSYHIPSFEVADFLGKADELIAKTPVKWGAPGHNKWDIDKTLTKWKPQAIIPGTPLNRSKNEDKQSVIDYLPIYGFYYDLMFSKKLAKNFSYCYIKNQKTNEFEDKWGFFLRSDLVQKYKKDLSCSIHYG